MTIEEKVNFVNELVENVKGRILQELNHTPEEWDGVELRWFVKDHFRLVVFAGYDDRRSKRAREYANHCLVHNIG